MADIIMFPERRAAATAYCDEVSNNFRVCLDAVKGTPGEYALNGILTGLAILADTRYRLTPIERSADTDRLLFEALDRIYEGIKARPNTETNLYSLESFFYSLSRLIRGR